MVEDATEVKTESGEPSRLRTKYAELNSGRFDGVWLCVLVIIAAVAPPFFQTLLR